MPASLIRAVVTKEDARRDNDHPFLSIEHSAMERFTTSVQIHSVPLERAPVSYVTHLTHELEIAANPVTLEKLLEQPSRTDENAGRSGSSAW
jgi:hypothetical protein